MKNDFLEILFKILVCISFVYLIITVNKIHEKPSAIIKGQVTIKSDEGDKIEISGCTIQVLLKNVGEPNYFDPNFDNSAVRFGVVGKD